MSIHARTVSLPSRPVYDSLHECHLHHIYPNSPSLQEYPKPLCERNTSGRHISSIWVEIVWVVSLRFKCFKVFFIRVIIHK